jgi:hypothetical protein
MVHVITLIKLTEVLGHRAIIKSNQRMFDDMK